MKIKGGKGCSTPQLSGDLARAQELRLKVQLIDPAHES
jgi:hypothetical protein